MWRSRLCGITDGDHCFRNRRSSFRRVESAGFQPAVSYLSSVLGCRRALSAIAFFVHPDWRMASWMSVTSLSVGVTTARNLSFMPRQIAHFRVVFNVLCDGVRERRVARLGVCGYRGVGQVNGVCGEKAG